TMKPSGMPTYDASSWPVSTWPDSAVFFSSCVVSTGPVGPVGPTAPVEPVGPAAPVGPSAPKAESTSGVSLRLQAVSRTMTAPDAFLQSTAAPAPAGSATAATSATRIVHRSIIIHTSSSRRGIWLRRHRTGGGPGSRAHDGSLPHATPGSYERAV